MNGQVYFYNYEGLKYLTQMNCRNRRGKFKKGTKVTGLSFLKTESEGLNVPHSYPFNTLPPLLVTTNDNRVRLFSLGDFSLRMKYKGLKNTHMQIKANFSDDGKYIVCGSEMGGIVIWETQPPTASSALSFLFSEQQDRNCSCESILNNSKIPDCKPKDKKPSISMLIGQRNNKRIQSAFHSLASKKDRSRNLNANTGFAIVDCVAATTAAIFAPVSSILHCARSGTPADSPLGSNSASMKSNHLSETSATCALATPDVPKAGQEHVNVNKNQGQGQGHKSAIASGTGLGGNQTGNQINSSTVKNGSTVGVSKAGGVGMGADSSGLKESNGIPCSASGGNRSAAKAGAAVDNSKSSDDNKGNKNNMKDKKDERKKMSQSHVQSCGTVSRDNGEGGDGEDLNSSERQEKGDGRDLSSSLPVPLSDLSSRVIVATDILGYIRVFVRSGK